MSRDSETGELWREHKKARQAKRADNLRKSTELLTENGIWFESKNDGIHLIVGTDNKVDFWPSTGKWIVRAGKSGRGVMNLVKYMKGGSS